MNAVLNTPHNRSTAEWQAADSAHYLHPFTDFKGLASKGSRVITRADNIYLWDSEARRSSTRCPACGASTSAMDARS